jgi:hypothetical protein
MTNSSESGQQMIPESIPENTQQFNGILTADLRILTEELFNTNFLSRLQSNVKLFVITDSCFTNSIFYSGITNSITKAKICLLTSVITTESDDYDINNSGLISTSIINSLIKKKDCTFIELAQLSHNYLSEHLSQQFILISTDDELLNSKFF